MDLFCEKIFIVDIHQETVSYAVPIHRVLQDPGTAHRCSCAFQHSHSFRRMRHLFLRREKFPTMCFSWDLMIFTRWTHLATL